MNIFFIRLFIFTILPLMIAGTLVLFDRHITNRERKIEIFLIYLFTFGVAGSGIGNFFGHFFLSDTVAAFIGWPPGNPFQLEVAFTNLALGILGLVATGRRDGFREATVIALSVFSGGATVVHIMDMVQTGNLAPGNSLQNISNLLKPTLLIVFLSMSRRTERMHTPERGDATFGTWHRRRVRTAGMITGIVATAFGVGFGLNQPAAGAAAGTVAGCFLIVSDVRQSRNEMEKKAA